MSRTSKNRDTSKENLNKGLLFSSINDEEELEEFEESEDMTEEEVEEIITNTKVDECLFDRMESMIKSGDFISYTVYRNGQYIEGSVPHPYKHLNKVGWDAIQLKHGEGTYQVKAKSTKSGKYAGSETKSLAPIYKESETSTSEAKSSSPTVDLLAILNAQKREEREEMERREERRLQEQREREEKAEKEREKREKEMREQSNNTNVMLMQMMKSQSDQTTALLTAMLGGGGRKEPEMNLEKVMTMMDQRMEKMIALVQGKDKTKDIDALKLIELQSTAEDRGYKRAMDLQAQAERKAEELADMRAEAGERPEAKESTVKTIMDALIPAAQTIMAARGGIPAAAPAAQLPVSSIPQINPHIPAQPRPQMGLPIAGAAPRVVVQPKEPMSKNQMIEKTVISEIGKDLSANLLTQKFDPEATADKCLKVLEPHGITPDSLCSAYNLDAMLKIAKANGMPDAIKPYIERFHAHIKNKATMGSGGTTQGSQQANS